MRTTGKSACMLVLTVLLCHVAVAGSADIDELSTMLDTFLFGATANDIRAHQRFWADDLVYTSSNGTRFGKADIIDGMRASATEPGNAGTSSPTVYTAEDVDIRIYGDTAVIAFRLIGTPANGKDPAQQYFNTGTFLKRDGVWRAVAWQATIIPGEGGEG